MEWLWVGFWMALPWGLDTPGRSSRDKKLAVFSVTPFSENGKWAEDWGTDQSCLCGRSLHKLTRNVGIRRASRLVPRVHRRVAPLGRVPELYAPSTDLTLYGSSICLSVLSFAHANQYSSKEMVFLSSGSCCGRLIKPEGSHGHFWPITHWWGAQVTTGTCEWHLSRGKFYETSPYLFYLTLWPGPIRVELHWLTQLLSQSIACCMWRTTYICCKKYIKHGCSVSKSKGKTYRRSCVFFSLKIPCWKCAYITFPSL